MNSNRTPMTPQFCGMPPPEYRSSMTWIFSCQTEGKGKGEERKGKLPRTVVGWQAEQQSQAQDFSRARDHGNI